MKAIVTLLIALVGCLGLSAQTPTEYFSVGNPINYCGTDFSLAWSSHPQANYYLQEYLPEGETFDNYTQMVTVSVIFWDRTPREAVEAKIAELEKRKQTDPVTNYMVAENNGEYILEFIVSDSTGNDDLTTVEVDVHHYRQMTINGRNASVLDFYSARAYGDDILPFIQSIPYKRPTWYEALSALRLTPAFPGK